jgi:hypothetical protein
VLRFTTYAILLLVLLLALFGLAVEVLRLEPASGAVVRLGLLEPSRVPASYALIAWTMEACGLLALFLIAQGRCGAWWLDGLMAGWLAWVFRGPLLVVTLTVAARQPQEPWWRIAFGWWVVYSVGGLALAWLYRRLRLEEQPAVEPAAAPSSLEPTTSTEPMPMAASPVTAVEADEPTLLTDESARRD